MAENSTKILSLDVGDFCRLFSYRAGTPFQAVLYLLLIARLSPAEASSLQWRDVDIERSIVHTSSREKKLPSSVVRYLRQFRFEQLERYFLRNQLQAFSYVCTQPDDLPYSEDSLLQAFSHYLTLCGHPGLSLETVQKSFPEYLYEHDMVSHVVDMYVENTRIRNPIE